VKEADIVIRDLPTSVFELVGLVDKVLCRKIENSRFAVPKLNFVVFSLMGTLESILKDRELAQKEERLVRANEVWALSLAQYCWRLTEGAIVR